MAADVEQDDLSLRDLQRERDTIAIDEADSLETCEGTAKVVQSKRRLIGVLLQLTEGVLDNGSKVRMALQKLACTPLEVPGRDQSPGPSSSSRSKSCIRVSTFS